jgi:histidine triad (HIT) family protein
MTDFDHRAEQHAGQSDPNCIFCRIASGDAPASLIAETHLALAFMDINQPTPGHVLVIPRPHVRTIDDLDAETGAAVFALTLETAKAVKQAVNADGLNLFQANEAAGQQEVFHFHMHIIARFTGDRDRIRFGWRADLPARDELDLLADAIRARLPD